MADDEVTREDMEEYHAIREREIRMIHKNNDFERFAKFCLRIKAKDGRIVPFVLNSAQKMLYEAVKEQRKKTGKVRIVVLKGRQQGISTFIQAYFWWIVSQVEGQRAFVLSHEASSTQAIFEMTQRFHQRCQPEFKPVMGKCNVKEMVYPALDSGYKVATASGTGQVGRGSTFTMMHCSEAAFYPPNNIGSLVTGCMQAVPDMPGTAIFIESTANGAGNYFHQLWNQAQAGEGDYMPVFIPWFCQKEYRRDRPHHDMKYSKEEKALVEYYELTEPQLLWRRAKVKELGVEGKSGESQFCQEYPNTSGEAFLLGDNRGIISPYDVTRARRAPEGHGTGPLIISCDPARYGADSTVIARRRGRKVYPLEVHDQQDTMQVAHILHKIIENEDPMAVFVDTGGLGAGVFDRLRDLGHFDCLRPMNGGNSPMDKSRYCNKRAEMWGIMAEWLRDTEMQLKLPDDDQLQSELVGVQYIVDGRGRIKLETKNVMRARGMRSPDRADAVCLLFAEPVFDEEGISVGLRPEIDF